MSKSWDRKNRARAQMEEVVRQETQDEKDKKAHKRVFMACGEYMDQLI